MYSKLSVIGLGVVGSAIYETFQKKNKRNYYNIWL